jgi:hypothetical protein
MGIEIDSGGSKGPERPSQEMKKLVTIENLETGKGALMETDEVTDPDTGKLKVFFKLLGRTGDIN